MFTLVKIFIYLSFVIMSTPLGGWTYYFLLFPASAVCRHTWFLVISRKSIYPIFTRFGMGVYWVNSLHGIAFGEDRSIACLELLLVIIAI